MNLKVFLELVEIKAKTASIFPFLLGLLYSAYHFKQVNLISSLIFFIAMLLFNMAVDINDNYQDYKRAQRHHADEFRLKTNVIGVNHLSIKAVGRLMASFVTISALLGIWLVSRSGLLLLILGIFCFVVGYLYAGGAKPLSALPLGEFFSGFTMGYMIFLITLYLNLAPQKSLSWLIVWQAFLPIGLLALAIAALLLANNICDQKEDLALNRRTIVYYLGKRRALILFNLLYLLGFVSLICAVWLNLLPKMSLLTLLVIPIIWRNLKAFNAKQVKKETFILAVKNLLILSLSCTVAVALGVLLHI
ncbi:1,4-dihydroxy-2-naphthoate polyprenyltransferase [Oenococcus sp.]|uniref:1,4-dihydroxy-2-naphthoate polyprenyltransferase n=1 Tax=Oenococcus sp. TaxID=1979414 RepID=UPI0039E78AD4